MPLHHTLANGLHRVRRTGRRAWTAVRPDAHAWRGAAWGALAVVLLILWATAYGLFAADGPLRVAAGLALFLVAFGLVGGALTLLWRVFRALPARLVWVFASALPALVVLALIAASIAIGVVGVGLAAMGLGALVGAAVAVLLAGRRGALPTARRRVALGVLAMGVLATGLGAGWLALPGTPRAAELPAWGDVAPLNLENPALPGPYPVQTLTYGSGHDRRAAFGADADLLTPTVDGSRLVEGWTALRTRYWGFGPDALPLNGRVWQPEGEGPFPLVVVLHGQHPMEDPSEGGYAYLGDLLASRGYVVVSVDENYLNLSPLADGLILSTLQEEDDLRAWLLLEHLRIWHEWQDAPGNPFQGRVDTERIALIGHSRGGEAVAIAAALNRLPYYPDDAALALDYGYGIRAVVGLAPVDGMYLPAGQPVALEDVSYLVLHGAHDMDVVTFFGAGQYARVSWTPGYDGLKAALYIERANHGQFNTAWGRKDLIEPVMRLFNLRQLMPGEDQRQVAAVTISAFLEATLRHAEDYRGLFQDHRRGAEWLPPTRYISRYADARTEMVATFEEDANLATGTLPGTLLRGEGLAEWREGPLRGKHQAMDNQVVYLGWEAGGAAPARYTIGLPEAPPDGEAAVVFSLADARPGGAAQEPLSLTLEFVDADGGTVRTPLERWGPPLERVAAQLGKAAWFSPLPTSEDVLQQYSVPLAALRSEASGWRPDALVEVRLVFDRSPEGRVALDDVGLRPGATP